MLDAGYIWAAARPRTRADTLPASLAVTEVSSMRRSRHLVAILGAVLALLLVPALAQASGTDVIRDCNYDGHIDGNYTQAEYEQAEQQLQGDNDQYSDCREVIAQARAGAGDSGSKKGGGSGGSGGGSNSSGGSGAGGSATGSSATGSTGGSGSKGGGSGSTDTRAGSPVTGQGDPKLATASGAYAPTADDKVAYEKALSAARLAPAATTPDTTNSIPLPVLIAIVSVGLIIAAASFLVARKRLPVVGRAALRVVRR
jgi:hypothetical protein